MTTFLKDQPIRYHHRPWRRPLVGLLPFFSDHDGLVLLESRGPHRRWARWSFLGVNPFWQRPVDSAAAYDEAADLFRRWQELLAGGLRDGPTPFPGGVMGFLGYDWASAVACGVQRRNTPHPPAWLGFFDTVVAWDRVRRHLWVTMVPRVNHSGRRLRWEAGQNRLFERILSVLDEAQKRPLMWPDVAVVRGRRRERTGSAQDYENGVARVLDLIRQGDVYQLNLCRRVVFFLDRPLSVTGGMALYQHLQAINPAPFAGYCDLGAQGLRIACASPEEFLRIEGDRAVSRPMKGTRPSHKHDGQRNRLARELWASEKERAELLMITDLLRNDLGQVCRSGTVRVNQLRRLERFEQVWQTTSEIEGTLKRGLDVWDVLTAMLPGGSVTGCPKRRAVERIARLEPEPRGAYTGVMGYAGLNQYACWNILIRSLFIEPKRIWYGVGSGVVADSTAEAEYEETRVKEQALRQAAGTEVLPPVKGGRWVYETPGFHLRPSDTRPPVWRGGYDGVFETMLACGRTVPLWPFHRERLARALQQAGVACDLRQVGSIIRNGVAAHPWPVQRLRLTVDLHTVPGRVRVEWFEHRLARSGRCDWVVGCYRLRRSLWTKGRLKSTRYQAFHRLSRKAEREGWHEAVLIHPDGWVVEGTRTNVFWIDEKGAVHTPHPCTGALPGVGARWVRRWLKQKGVRVHEKRYSHEDLTRARAVFLTNAVRGVVRAAALKGFGRTVRFQPHELITALQQSWFQMIETALQSGSIEKS